MYGRTELEADLAWLEEQRAVGARLLVEGRITGFDKLALDREIDTAEQKCRGKLAGVRMAITDRETMIRSGKMVYWKRSAKTGQLLIKRHGEYGWRVTTQQYLDQLRATGYFVIEMKGFPPRNGEASSMNGGHADTVDASPLPFARREVTLEEAKQLVAEGAQVIWRPDGRECAVVIEYC